MSSCPRKHLMYKPNQPQFFKIILDDSLLERKLGIPKKFVRNYGNNLSNAVILKVPSGEKWKIDTLKVDGQIWLEKGWDKFMEYYSIIIGSLLVFQYDESNCCFNVNIFDSTCTEIDYPYSIIKVESDEIPIEISDNQFSPSRKRKEKSPLSSSRLHKKMKKVEKFTNIARKGKKENPSSSFQSQTPSFQIKMKPSYFHGSHPDIPATFARKYIKRKDGNALLIVLDGKTWSVKYASGVRRTRLMHSGWIKFVRDNYLQVGDVCKFELIDPEKTLFGVVISRSTPASGSCSKQSMDKKTSTIPPNTSSSNSPGAAQKFTLPNPSFKVVIKSSHLEGRVNVPFNFMKNLEQTAQNAKLVVYGKMWDVKLLLYPYCGKGILSKGWAAFARENSVEVGDACTFQLIGTQELLIKVSISKDLSTNLA
ncbi:B3 domain-containing transcription factor VRN1-like [Euphorbia lathyris]|uniref:B3 domain-containing transcription factor VRN1-like n=1 Tax=Euphorbia lathyris TaxID=212925 RepID=UPI003313D0A1